MGASESSQCVVGPAVTHCGRRSFEGCPDHDRGSLEAEHRTDQRARHAPNPVGSQRVRRCGCDKKLQPQPLAVEGAATGVEVEPPLDQHVDHAADHQPLRPVREVSPPADQSREQQHQHRGPYQQAAVGGYPEAELIDHLRVLDVVAGTRLCGLDVLAGRVAACQGSTCRRASSSRRSPGP